MSSKTHNSRRVGHRLTHPSTTDIDVGLYMKAATMKKILTGTIALAVMLGVSSCSSDKSSSSATTAAASDTSAASADSTAASAGSATGTLQDQAIAVMLAGPPPGVTFDEACFTAAMTGLSDADAQLIIDGGPTGNPVLSPEGTALATAGVTACGTLTSTT